MTETLFMIYSAAAAAVTLWLLGGMAVGRMRRRRRRGRDAVLQRKYLHIVMLALFSGGEEAPRFPLLRRAGARRLLIETVGLSLIHILRTVRGRTVRPPTRSAASP